MAEITFDTAAYNSVRAVINTALTAKKLPNATIAFDIYQGEAVRMVKRLLSQDQIDAHTASATTAAIYFCAALVLPAVSQIEKEKIAGGEVAWKVQDVTKRAEALKAQAIAICNEIDALDDSNESNTAKLRPQMFGLAKNKRTRQTYQPDSFEEIVVTTPFEQTDW